MSIFKACDIRGTYGEDLTEADAHAIGRAVATLVGGGRVAVAGDTRRSTPALKAALIAGLAASGADVVDLGALPTPAFSYALRTALPGPGVMVTASHNPARHNGFKVTLGPRPTSPEDVAALRGLVESGEFATGKGSVRQQDLLPQYRDWLVRTALPLEGLGVVVDAGGGVAGPVAAEVFERLGARLTPVGCEPDPDLAQRDPNPAKPGALMRLEGEVRRCGAALGLGLDGDGDRVIFADDTGRTVSGDVAGTVLLKLVVPREPGAAVVYDLKCSSAFAETARGLGFAPHMERSGYAFMRRRMLDEQALFGCEMSGHLFFGELAGADDALYAGLGLAGVLAGAHGPRLSELIDRLPRYASTADLRVPWPPSEAPRTLDTLLRAHAALGPSTLDGVRVDFGPGWALARASVTEPLLTLRFEAESPDNLAEIIGRFLEPTPDLREAVAPLLTEGRREAGD